MKEHLPQHLSTCKVFFRGNNTRRVRRIISTKLNKVQGSSPDHQYLGNKVLHLAHQYLRYMASDLASNTGGSDAEPYSLGTSGLNKYSCSSSSFVCLNPIPSVLVGWARNLVPHSILFALLFVVLFVYLLFLLLSPVFPLLSSA